jgi:hypothetical protein
MIYITLNFHFTIRQGYSLNTVYILPFITFIFKRTSLLYFNFSGNNRLIKLFDMINYGASG